MYIKIEGGFRGDDDDDGNIVSWRVIKLKMIAKA
jgi:hypothetical protein